LNYLAHLFLAKPTADSHFGNLLGDFSKGVDLSALPPTVKEGLKNHYLVDNFTDRHPLIQDGRHLFSKEKRRFSGIAIDVLFDYFLIKHWSTFSTQSFIAFKQQSYRLLAQNQSMMPAKMRRVTQHMIQHDWFLSYSDLSGIGQALDNIAARIRFENKFSGSIEEIQLHYESLESIFLGFFPELVAYIEHNGCEV